jgi:hypothetical protein
VKNRFIVSPVPNFELLKVSADALDIVSFVYDGKGENEDWVNESMLVRL